MEHKYFIWLFRLVVLFSTATIILTIRTKPLWAESSLFKYKLISIIISMDLIPRSLLRDIKHSNVIPRQLAAG